MFKNNSHIVTLACHCLFISAIVMYGVVTFQYVYNAEVWGPYDELPHVDYMDRLAFEKRLPKDSELISDRTHRFHLDLKTVNGPGYDGSKAGLGPIGYSYEAHQPPLYYFVMTIPYKLVMGSQWPPRKKVRILRLISFSLHFIGIIMILPVFGQLRKLFPGRLNRTFGYLLFMGVWLTSVNLRFGISNDHLSMLMVNCSLFFLLKTWRKGGKANLLLTSLFITAAFFTKQTNLLAVLIVTGLLTIYMWRKRDGIKMWRNYLMLFPLLAIPAYFCILLIVNGTQDWLGNSFAKSLFSIMQPDMFTYKDFLKLQSIDFFSFYFLHIFYKKTFLLGSVIFLAAAAGYISSLLFSRTFRPYWTIAVLSTLALYFCMWLLNKYVCCVVWFSFRLYSGYMLFIIFGLLGYLSINKKWMKYIHLVILLCIQYPAIHYLIHN